ncbi:hypothetical protein Gohar_014093 [Gossypium harknessii]|uniref:Uncharacterized protein n=1 Tax=Gossypium harknessii TaxID=34285 RepID=A0A7J9H3K5_9ROSI|nr:hypothetical protein [Gossypium harknessii]
MQKDLHGLSSLKTLDLSGTNIENLPTTIKQPPWLEELILWECKRLKSLPELPPSLGHLDAHDCTSLEEVSSIKKLFEQALLYAIWASIRSSSSSSISSICEIYMLNNRIMFLIIVIEQGCSQRNKVIACVPGSEILEWIHFRSLGSSIIIQLPSEWYCYGKKKHSRLHSFIPRLF